MHQSRDPAVSAIGGGDHHPAVAVADQRRAGDAGATCMLQQRNHRLERPGAVPTARHEDERRHASPLQATASRHAAPTTCGLVGRFARLKTTPRGDSVTRSRCGLLPPRCQLMPVRRQPRLIAGVTSHVWPSGGRHLWPPGGQAQCSRTHGETWFRQPATSWQFTPNAARRSFPLTGATAAPRALASFESREDDRSRHPHPQPAVPRRTRHDLLRMAHATTRPPRARAPRRRPRHHPDRLRLRMGQPQRLHRGVHRHHRNDPGPLPDPQGSTSSIELGPIWDAEVNSGSVAGWSKRKKLWFMPRVNSR